MYDNQDMNMKKGTFLLLFMLSFVVGLAQDYRYTKTLFPSSTAIPNVVYGTAPFIDGPLYTMEESTTTQNLVMDIFKPTGDTFSLRPAIIMAHSGGFLTGNRNVNDMMALCDSLARKGYVTATIDYRQGFSLVENVVLHSTRAVYRGLQDGRSAVRFLRAHASEYGIDPTKIYFVGSSAGSFIALHSIYLDTPAEKPALTGTNTYTNVTYPFTHTAPDLGPLDIGQNLTFNGKPDAVVSMWGAIETTDLITPDNNTPVLLIHGEADTTVPFNTGSPFGYSSLPQSQGSNIINTKLDALGFTNKETYFVAGQNHEFYGTTNGTWSNGTGGNSYYPIVFNKIVQFLWKRHKPLANFDWTPNNLSATFTDTSTGSLAWWWDFGDGTYSNDPQPTHVYATAGDYTVKLYVENNIKSWDEITKTVTVSNLATSSYALKDFTIAPNPTSGWIRIHSNEAMSHLACQVTDITGKIIMRQIVSDSSMIDLTALSQGMYVVTLTSDESSKTFKIVKQ
ncbi:PKD domain-containing protein [Flavobacterium aciduliphilum]|uniref:Putative secreted protein (Por secretion system target) n=1 Tax=Flavobacterium aciduliphilum TaxID=1101402 RepID=A0A328YFW0_9FLAO|nr:PKD domain-containing protein [Flavobacterium aciduliphilum]RAR71575.1 putative secreted protein (Por secretion system target) [Flavobacterium aciduliphilum]